MGRQRQSCVLPLITLLATLSSAVNLDCKHLQSEKQVWDLHKLSGPHSVYHTEEAEGAVHNTTYTVDICSFLEKKSSGCEHGTYVCGAVTIIPKDGTPFVDQHINIAGNYVMNAGPGRTADPKITNLMKVDEREGVRLELHGGRHPFDGKHGEKQMAVIDFVCDQDRTGNEESESEENKKRRVKTLREAVQPPRSKPRSLEDGDEEKDDDESSQSLRFKSYGHDDEHGAESLHLEWHTKYACDSYEDDTDSNAGNHWGFFTWFIVLLFLCASAYLIFGSWLNYNRYGARGWDMLPHGDTLRDVPYLFRDWARRVVNTISGPGSRGGYSAV